MYILYADDAGNTGVDYDNIQQPIFSLAGIIVEDGAWLGINEKIKTLKQKIIPHFPNAEIHATDIFGGKKSKNGLFNFRQNSVEENRKILSSFVDIVVSESLPIIYFSVRKGNLKDYCNHNFGGAIKIDPYIIAFPYVTSFFDHYVTERKSRGLIMLDEQKSIVSNIDNAFFQIQSSGKAVKLFHANNIIERALFLESSKSNFIQLADVCNFYINRYISMEYGIRPSEDKCVHFQSMWKKIEPLIVPPPFDPYKETGLFRFFNENREALGK